MNNGNVERSDVFGKPYFRQQAGVTDENKPIYLDADGNPIEYGGFTIENYNKTHLEVEMIIDWSNYNIMMEHKTNKQLRDMYLGFLKNFFSTFWQDIQLAKTPEEAILRYEGVCSISMLDILKKREIFTQNEHRILVVLTEAMVYIFNSHSDEFPWQKLTKDEEMIILHLFNLRAEATNNLPLLLAIFSSCCVRKPRRCPASPTFSALPEKKLAA